MSSDPERSGHSERLFDRVPARLRRAIGVVDAGEAGLHLVSRFWVLVLISTVALGTLTVVPVLAQRSLGYEDAHERAQVVSQLSGRLVQQQLGFLAELTQLYAEQVVVAARDETGEVDYESPIVRELLRELYNHAPSMRDVVITDMRGQVRAVEPSSTEYDGPLDVWAWYRELGNRPANGTEDTLIVSEHRGTITTVAVLRTASAGDEPGLAVGTLVANYDAEKSLQRLVEELAREGIRLSVTDGQGVVVAGQVGDVATGMIDPVPGPPAGATPEGETGVTRHGDMVSGFAPVEDLGWTVRADVSLRPLWAALARSRTAVLMAAVALGLMLLISLTRLATAIRRGSHAEAELRSSEQHTRAILSAASDGFLSADRHGRLVDVNEHALELFGWRREEALGRPLETVVAPPEDRAELRKLVRSYLNGSRPLPAGPREGFGYHRTQGVFPVEVSAWLSDGPDRADVTLDAFVRDITERVRSREALAAARDEAMQMSRLKSQFLANMSHEIRTPLAGVIGMSELLLETDLTDEQRSYGDAMVEAGEHLLSVIGHILDLSKLEVGKLILESSIFDPVGVVERVSHMLRVTAEAKGVELSTVIDEEVPRRVAGDGARLEQILMNLAGNAVKFTSEGGVLLQLEAVDDAVDEDGDDTTVRLRFCVADTGPGLDVEQADALFDPFVQGDPSTSRTFGGSGLGLSIVRHLTALFGGDIQLESELGRGSRFVVELPFERAPMEVRPEDVEAPTTNERPRVLAAGAHVLVVEDNELNQRLAAALVHKLGPSVTVVSSGHRALEVLADEHVDLVLIDCQMPVLDGYETTRRLRAAERDGRRHTPVIAMTANALREDRQRCLDAGMDDYLAKPVRAADLRRALGRWIEADTGVEEPQHGEVAVPGSAVPGAVPDELLDDVVLTELVGVVPPEVMEELLDGFDTSSRRLLAALEDAAGRADAADVARLAHELKSVTASLGAQAVAAQCQRLEDPDRAVDDLTGALGELRELLADTRRALEGWRPLAGARLP
jgi:PAS domain S-box-containing protein